MLPTIIKTIIWVIVILAIISVILSNVRIVPQPQAYIIERFGAYHTTWRTGFHVKMPFIDRIANKVSLKEIVLDFDPQSVITKDNVTMQIDTVVYCQVTDPKLYTYGIETPMSALENLTATTLRNIIGDLELDETLTSRDVVNAKMRSIVDEATDPWGIKVNRVELKNIMPPRDIQESMEKQMRAERDRRETILQAEGEKKAAILRAEGEKESMILRANAKKEAMVAEAEGQAQAMERVYAAQAYGIKAINEANPGKAYITMEGYKALEKVADGKSTKLIIPSEIQNIAGTLAALGEVVQPQENKVNEK
ncbi:MAG: SPFH/Band 7/PHB domain protein [Erysipelotrichaceae bacterium]|nr:SPFH/Band 7/PHB domain protein [Erysipelotrichaceae bacterium]